MIRDPNLFAKFHLRRSVITYNSYMWLKTLRLACSSLFSMRQFFVVRKSQQYFLCKRSSRVSYKCVILIIIKNSLAIVMH